jgi:protein-disulfide isomerase
MGSLQAAPAAPQPDPALVDGVARQLESSGALDAAVERAIDRYIARKEQAHREEQEQKTREIAKRVPAVDLKSDHVRGSPAAAVSLIEYTDLECPFCKQFHPTPKALVERYGGRVNWVMRNLPLPIHGEAARKEALAAECVARSAGNEAYWRFVDAVFANTRSNGNGLPQEHSAEKLARDAGANESALRQCMSDPAMAAHIDRETAQATSAGATGTPTTIVRNNANGESEAVVGAVPQEVLAREIDRLLAPQASSAATK